MASFRKRNGRWQVQVRRKGANPETATFDTKAAAERWARKIEREVDEGRSVGRPRVKDTLRAILQQYEVKARETQPLGDTKVWALAKLADELGDIAAQSLNADHLIAYAARRREAGAGAVTVGIELSYLSSALRSARGLLGIQLDARAVVEARAALASAGLGSRSHERERIASQGEINALCDYFRRLPRQLVPMAELIEIAVATAMRREEICRLRWIDLDRAGRTIVIRDRKDPRRKAGNDEVVPLLAVTGYDALTIIERQPKGANEIFPVRADTISTIFPRACRALGIVDLRFHDLRHTAVTRMFEAGMAIEEVALCSGHKDWRTLRRYTHIKAGHLVRRYARASTE